MAHKTGKYLEELIAWIQSSVHEKALVIPNEKVLDIHTKTKRQIDISIRLSDGPTHLFVMVEVRDHKRPIDVRYVEEVHSKKQSVNANAASIVSKSGFTKTAIEKAKYLGIQTLTYKEALKSDWSGWIKCEYFSVITKKYENVLIIMGKENSNEILNIAPEILLQTQNNAKSKVLLNNDGKSVLSFFDLAWSIINPSIEKLCEGLEPNGEKVRRSIMFNGILEPQLNVLGNDGITHKITKVKVEADFYIEVRQYPIHISKFQNTESDESIAEVATADLEVGDKKLRFEILAPNANDSIPSGSKVQIRTTPLDDETKNSNDE